MEGAASEAGFIFADCRDHISPDRARALGANRNGLARRRAGRVGSFVGERRCASDYGISLVRRVSLRAEGTAEGVMP